MCGIVCAFNTSNDKLLRSRVLEMAKTIRHRGPDWSGIFDNEKAVMAHERLAIVDPASGKQPLYSPNGQLVLAANGEIYNHRELRSKLTLDYEFQTQVCNRTIVSLTPTPWHAWAR